MKRIGIAIGMIGWYAVLYDEDGLIQTGIGRYQTPEEARAEAEDWSIAEGYPLEPIKQPLRGAQK